eukprot:1999329-Ditylum_brightwellii.AAC.1
MLPVLLVPLAAPSAPVFLPTPNQVALATFIDYQTSTGTKLCQTATAALPITFNAESKQANLFCEALGE